MVLPPKLKLSIKIELPHDAAIPLPDVCPTAIKPRSGRVICTPIFIAALFTVANIWKSTSFFQAPTVRKILSFTPSVYTGYNYAIIVMYAEKTL